MWTGSICGYENGGDMLVRGESGVVLSAIECEACRQVIERED